MPMDLSRYPADWTEISQRIRERAGWRCEWCGVPNGVWIRRHRSNPATFDRLTGDDGNRGASRVVLTVHHIGAPRLFDVVGPTESPFFFHVAGAAKADEVFDAVRFLVALQSERFEGAKVMHDGAIAERFAVASTSPARFGIAQPRSTAGLFPRDAIEGSSATPPIWMAVTPWGDVRKPTLAATVATESRVTTGLIGTYFERFPTLFATVSGPVLATFGEGTGARLTFTRLGTGFLGLLSLLDVYGEGGTTDLTGAFGCAPPNGCVGDRLATALDAPVLGEALRRADALLVMGLLHRERKGLFTDDTDSAGGRLPGLSSNAGRLLPPLPTCEQFASAVIGTSGSPGIGERGEWRGTDCAGLHFHTCIIPQYHIAQPHPIYTPGDRHDKMDVRDANLAALCQRCHFLADLDIHIANAAATRRRRRVLAGQLEMELAT